MVPQAAAPVLPPSAAASRKKQKPRGQLLLSEEDEAKFTAAFNLLDADGDGEIDAEELKDLMTRLGYKPHDDDIAGLIALADQDDSGTINLREFLQLMVGAVKDKALKAQYIA